MFQVALSMATKNIASPAQNLVQLNLSMVYAPERPTEQSEQHDRPYDRSFFMESSLFFACHQELMPELYGLTDFTR